MIWVLIWTVLVAGACTVLFLLGRRVWRQLSALTRELGEATDRLGQITDRLAELDATRSDLAAHHDGVRSQGPRRRP
jgi:hypothetical protein